MDYNTYSSPVPSRMSLQNQQPQQENCTLQQERESEGRCGLCGVQTHRLYYQDSGYGRILCKEPLNVEGEVKRGRCLLCHPLPVQDCDYSVHSGSASSGCAPYASMMTMNPSPNNICEFPFTVQSQQQSPFPPLPLQSRHQPNQCVAFPPLPHQTNRRTALSMAQEPSIATIQSLPNADTTTILILMHMHPSSPALISTALQTLQIQSSDEQNAAALGRLGGIGTILDSISNYITSAPAVQSGIATLYNLSLQRLNLPLMPSAVRTIVSVMDAHPLHPSIQRYSILTLGNIAKYSIDFKILICEEGGMMAIMKAVEMFGEGMQANEDVLRSAYWSLRRLGMPRLNGLADENVGGDGDGDEE